MPPPPPETIKTHKASAHALSAIARSLARQQDTLVPDIEYFSRLTVGFEVFKATHDTRTLLTMVSLYEEALPVSRKSRVWRSGGNAAEALLNDTLHRIARHMRDRAATYSELHSLAKKHIDNASYPHRTESSVATFDDAIAAVKILSPRPTDPEEVHAALRKISAAAHCLIFLQRDQIEALQQQLKRQETAFSELQEKNRELEHHLRHRNQVKIASDRPLMVRADEAHIVAKLVSLRTHIEYPRMPPGRAGKKVDPISWVRLNLGGSQGDRLSSDELEVVLAKPTLIKPFDSRLYLTLQKRREMARKGERADVSTNVRKSGARGANTR